MKEFITIIIILLLNHSCFAQRTIEKSNLSLNPFSVQSYFSGDKNSKSAEKTTSIGDTTTISNILSTDTLTIFTLTGIDSGYATGTNVYNDQAFAERFDFNSSDSSVIVIGVYALFTGKVNPSSTNSVVFKIWDIGAPQMITTQVYYSGFPNNILDSLIVPFTELGIGTTKDTLKKFMFATPTNALSMPFFAGYSVNYNFNSLNGDTIGLQCSLNGERTKALYQIDTIISGTDTVRDTTVFVQNATQWSDNTWYENYTQNDSLFNNLAIFPIVVSHNATSTKGITKSGLTFLGNYPNPANDFTNVRFSLEANHDVSISVMDETGKIVLQYFESNLPAGAHSIRLNTTNLNNGNYYYLLRVNGITGIAGKLNVFKN